MTENLLIGCVLGDLRLVNTLCLLLCGWILCTQNTHMYTHSTHMYTHSILRLAGFNLLWLHISVGLHPLSLFLNMTNYGRCLFIHLTYLLPVIPSITVHPFPISSSNFMQLNETIQTLSAFFFHSASSTNSRGAKASIVGSPVWWIIIEEDIA